MMKKQFLLAAFCSMAFALTACGGGGGDDSAPLVATSDLSADVNPTNGTTAVAGVNNTGFTFANGVPDFGTTGPTTVTLKSDAVVTSSGSTGPGFTVTSGSQSASGSLEFGSCIFNVTQSTFTSGPLVPGARIV